MNDRKTNPTAKDEAVRDNDTKLQDFDAAASSNDQENSEAVSKENKEPKPSEASVEDSKSNESESDTDSIESGSADAMEKDTEVAKLTAELETVQAQLQDYKSRYMRLYAEFENARKRMERERQEFVKYASEDVVVGFLSVLDNLELTVQAAMNKHEDYEAFRKGIEMVMTQVYELLKKQGVEPIVTDGQKFDPHCHEILMQEENQDQVDGAILQVFQKGYKMHEKVIRTAKIKVNQNPTN
jgi:molecular chaperone GrpE